MAARFLSSAFAAGPALLIILALIVKRFSMFDPGKEAIQTLGTIVTYFMITSCFFLGLEFFTAFYSGIPGHMESFIYLYKGLQGHDELVPIMWTSTILAVISIGLLIFPFFRRNERILAFASASVVISLWIDKGFGLIVGGFIPNPFEEITDYWPTLPEFLISAGIWAIGFLILTALYKIAVSIKEETGGEPTH